jgi:uncharacterized small protein (DUF1192 family)
VYRVFRRESTYTELADRVARLEKQVETLKQELETKK